MALSKEIEKEIPTATLRRDGRKYLSDEGYFKAKSYFGRVFRGNDEEYRTPFYKGKSLQEVLDGWSKLMKPLEHELPSLFAFENDLKSKVGPMSIMKPLSERIEDVGHYYEDILRPQEPLSIDALDEAARFFGFTNQLKQRDKHATLSAMKLSTNSGAPYFTKRRKVVDDTVEAVVDLDGTHYLHDRYYQNAAILGWRGQEGGPSPDDVKQRVVWMFPFAVNLWELSVYQSVIESSQLKGTVPPWIGNDAVDECITKLFDTKSPEDLIVCTDFSKFDQHFGQSMQDAAAYLLRKAFRNTHFFDYWMEHIFPIKYEIPIMLQSDIILTGKHGMASGSGGTNCDETLSHKALQFEAALSAGEKLNEYSMCLGDDGILSYPGITVDNVVETYTQHGLEMNVDKQYASSEDCVFLRRWHSMNYRIDGKCVGVYSTYRALGRLCEQERFYDPDEWGPKMVALRQLSILENVKYHPYREEFVKYCMKGDVYRLGLDIPDFLSNIDSIAKQASALIPDFLSYSSTFGDSLDHGMSHWWIVEYLKSLS